HCRTRNVMDNEMLFIRHVPVEDPQPAGVPVTVDARILCHPSNSLTDHDVFYRVGTSGSFAELAMSSTGSDSFTADIPGVPGSQTVQYYIAASDDSGRDEAMPRFAPDTWFFQYQTSATGIGGGGAADAGVFLANAGPNPFRSIVSLGYSVSSTVSVTFSVMDISGRMVYCGESGLEAGSGSLTWVPDDDTPAGMYVLRVEGPDWSHAQRVTLIR
ncbi:MAG: T9SS type A sorting domain-containing protein, partial [Candidatus Fermentibacteraceae bacterium]|nr:T9SS type A sorting domain-containing protein [Candidatus Fermentibacteraceae bacterium]